MSSSVFTAEYVISNLRWVAATILLATVIHLIISFAKKYRKNREIWNSVKDITDVSAVTEGKATVMGTIMQEVKCGDLSRRTQPNGYLITALTPESAKVIMDGVDKKTNYNWKLFKPFLGEGLLSSHGAKWYRNRKMLTPAFHFGVLKDYVHLFQESMEYYLACISSPVLMTAILSSGPHAKYFSAPLKVLWSEKAKKGESVEVTEDIDFMTIKALIKCAFGDFPLSESKRLEMRQYIKDAAACWMYRFNNYLLSYDFIYFLTSDGRKFKNAITKSRDLSRQVIREKQAKQRAGEKHSKKYKDFLDIIIEARDEDGNPLSEQELIDEVQTFFLAGHDTTASAIPYVLYNLAKHPEYQEKCRNEIEEVMEGKRNFEWNDLAKLEFFNMCIKESLRLHPPVWAVNRQSTKPKVFPDGRTLPVDSQIGLGIYAILHNPKLWENPDVFDPYRFHPDKADKIHPYAYVPFAGGTRTCIGKNFALTEIRVCVASTLRRFRLSLDPQKPLEMYLVLLLKTKDGLWLKLEELQQRSKGKA